MIVFSRRLPARATIALWKCWFAVPSAFVVVGGGRDLAFLHRRPDGGHSFGAAPAADGADFDHPANGVDVVDIAGLQACHKDPAVGVPDHQPFGWRARRRPRGPCCARRQGPPRSWIRSALFPAAGPLQPAAAGAHRPPGRPLTARLRAAVAAAARRCLGLLLLKWPYSRIYTIVTSLNRRIVEQSLNLVHPSRSKSMRRGSQW